MINLSASVPRLAVTIPTPSMVANYLARTRVVVSLTMLSKSLMPGAALVHSGSGDRLNPTAFGTEFANDAAYWIS